jgi:cytidylate kinase
MSFAIVGAIDGRGTEMTVIAMTREMGSRGADVAAGIARELGLRVIHSKFVASQVAGRLGVEEAAILRYVAGAASLIERWLIDRRKLSSYTLEEILRLAQRGNVLIRGWGAATLLRDLPRVISVRVCAPMDFRVRVMMERLGATDAEAIRGEIERYDAAHGRAMRGSFNVEQEDARLYHLVLNTDRLPVDACVGMVCELARHPRFRDHKKTRWALADKLLEAKISSALGDEIGPGMAPAGVTVSAADGRITLAGTSSSGRLRARAERVAASVAGVRAIDNRIVSVPTRGSAFPPYRSPAGAHPERHPVEPALPSRSTGSNRLRLV